MGQLTSQKEKCFGSLTTGALFASESKGIASQAIWASGLHAHFEQSNYLPKLSTGGENAIR
jgi:hypothetical protein